MDGTQHENSRSHSLQRGERNRHDPAFPVLRFMCPSVPFQSCVLCHAWYHVRSPGYLDTSSDREIYGLRGAWTHDESVRQPLDECLLCNLRALSIIARFAGSKRIRTAFTIEPTEISDTESYHIRLSEVRGSVSNRML